MDSFILSRRACTKLFWHSLTSVLTARFLMNLQKIKRREECYSLSSTHVSDLAFEPVVPRGFDGFAASFGRNVSFGENDIDEAEEDEVWRQQYIPQNLREVFDIERDGEKVRDGNTEGLVYQD